MAIDTSGKWWKGQNADDLVECVRLLTQQGYPATKFAIAKCACGMDRFRLCADWDEGCAKRQCASCGKEAFICDSEDASEEASLKQARCKCKKEVFELRKMYDRGRQDRSGQPDRKPTLWSAGKAAVQFAPRQAGGTPPGSESGAWIQRGNPGTVSTKLARIAEQSKRNAAMVFTTLAHLMDEDFLTDAPRRASEVRRDHDL